MIPDFSKSRVLIVGDVILDRFISGECARLSREAPVPVVVGHNIKECAGGAANVASNVASLGANATLIGLIGSDNEGERLEELIKANGAHPELIRVAEVGTSVKSRLSSKGQMLLRLDEGSDFYQSVPTQTLFDKFQACLPHTHVVVLSDYDSGCLKDVQALIQQARRAAKPVFIDPKQKDFSCYSNANLLKPNLSEFEEVVGPCKDSDEIVTKGLELKERLNLDILLVTRSEDGMTLLQDAEHVYHLETQAYEVYDIIGAGDTVIATLAAAYSRGLPMVEAVGLANHAAGVVVEKLGTATVTCDELRNSLNPAVSENTICTKHELIERVCRARAEGLRIVMTNGCFDILHAGHIYNLSEAATLGDRLIVAVNDDASVTALKGKGRPINTIENRMNTLAVLKMVDWVVPFSETTPLALVEAISPDVLVKGGDYKASQVDGYEHVKHHGGQVVILDYLEGFSTTELLKKLGAQQ